MVLANNPIPQKSPHGTPGKRREKDPGKSSWQSPGLEGPDYPEDNAGRLKFKKGFSLGNMRFAMDGIISSRLT
jgi:hypothetical protein